jgi:hypothetical protein
VSARIVVKARRDKHTIEPVAVCLRVAVAIIVAGAVVGLEAEP